MGARTLLVTASLGLLAACTGSAAATSNATSPTGGPDTISMAGDVIGTGDYLGYVVQAPLSFEQMHDSQFLVGSGGVDALGMSVWDVQRIPSDPCHWDGSMRPAGGTVAKTVASPENQRLRNATPPTAVTLGGFEGQYLELHVPADMIMHGDGDFRGCDVRGNGHTDFVSWIGHGGGERWEQVPGQVDMVWVIDVDGQPLVVDATYSPDVSPEQRQELTSAVQSIRFS